MTNNDLALLGVLVDHSGSMRDCREDMEGGLNTLLDEQRKQKGQCEITLAEFDDEYDLVWKIQSIDQVGKYTLRPRGMTRFLDAMGKFITYVGEELRSRSESQRPGKVIIVVVTDGKENDSREWKLDQVKKLIDEQQTQWSWEFLFLGADIDAVGEAGKIGIKTGSSLKFDKRNRNAVYAASGLVSNMVSDYRESGILRSYTDKDRESAMGGKAES